MDCARNEKLLALQAGGDLPDAQARALSAHLRECEDCRRTAADFAAGRELLALHEPPEFDAAFFDAVRRNVLREIDGGPPPPPAFARLTALLFGRRALALAACVAFLVVAGSMALYLREGREGAGSGPRQLAGSPRETQPEPAAAPVINSPAIRDAERQPKTTATIVASLPHRKQLGATLRRATRAKRDARMSEPLAPAFVAAAAPDDTQAVNTASPGEEAASMSEVAVLEAPAGRKMLRIELQTGDPNVRIIWLTPQEPEKLPR